MRLFLDTSVLLAASGSTRGASREIFRLAPEHGWSLIATPYVIEEVLTNIGTLGTAAAAEWDGTKRCAVRKQVIKRPEAALGPRDDQS